MSGTRDMLVCMTWISDFLQNALRQVTTSAEHAAHLASDATDICIPEFNALSYAPVDYHPVQPVQQELPQVEIEPFATQARVVVHPDRTDALIDPDLLAHHRECGDESCSDVWVKARRRRREFPGRTYVLAAGHILHIHHQRPAAILRPIDEFIKDRRSLAWIGLDLDSLDRALRAYEASATTAKELTAGHLPSLPPLPPSAFEPGGTRFPGSLPPA